LQLGIAKNQPTIFAALPAFYATSSIDDLIPLPSRSKKMGWELGIGKGEWGRVLHSAIFAKSNEA